MPKPGARAGKTMDFSLTTNATLLTPALIDYFAMRTASASRYPWMDPGPARPASQERRRAGHRRCRRAQGALAARPL